MTTTNDIFKEIKISCNYSCSKMLARYEMVRITLCENTQNSMTFSRVSLMVVKPTSPSRDLAASILKLSRPPSTFLVLLVS